MSFSLCSIFIFSPWPQMFTVRAAISRMGYITGILCITR